MEVMIKLRIRVTIIMKGYVTIKFNFRVKV